MKYLFLLLSFLQLAVSQTTPREHPACGLMLGKVYCFGGARIIDQNTATDDNVVNVLDLTNKTGFTPDELMSAWRTVSPDTTAATYDIRMSPQAIAIDDYRFLINGGFTQSQPANQTIVYNALQNKFYPYAAYTEPPYGGRQIYYAAAVNVPDKGVALYGGFEEYINTAWVTNATNTAAFNFNGNLSRTIGFVQVAFFSINNTNPWSVPVPLMTRQAFFAARLQGIYDPVNNYILYLGGEKRSNDPVNYTQNAIMRPFSEGLAFSTVNNTWIPISITGDVPSSGRYSYTLTLLTSTNRHALLYGGDNAGIAATDYCYTLNLDTLSWQQQIIRAPTGTTLIRSQHQAVLVNNETLLILWGVDGNQQGVTDMVILNVSTPGESITLLTKYVDPNSTVDVNFDTTPSTGLSTGAKAGIAVACVIAGILAILGIIYYVRKSRKQREKHKLDDESENRHEQDTIPMEVDWDRIEEKYIEVPQANFGNTNTTTGSTTVVGEQDHRVAAPTKVHPDGIHLERPHAYDDDYRRPQKPDGFA